MFNTVILPFKSDNANKVYYESIVKHNIFKSFFIIVLNIYAVVRSYIINLLESNFLEIIMFLTL